MFDVAELFFAIGKGIGILIFGIAWSVAQLIFLGIFLAGLVLIWAIATVLAYWCLSLLGVSPDVAFDIGAVIGLFITGGVLAGGRVLVTRARPERSPSGASTPPGEDRRISAAAAIATADPVVRLTVRQSPLAVAVLMAALLVRAVDIVESLTPGGGPFKRIRRSNLARAQTLSRDLARDLGRALDRPRARDLDIAIDSARTRRDGVLDPARSPARVSAQVRAFALGIYASVSRNLVRDLALGTYASLNRGLALVLARDSALDIACDLTSALTRTLILDLDLTSARALACDLEGELDSARALALDIPFDLGLAIDSELDRARDIARARGLEFDSALARAIARTLNHVSFFAGIRDRALASDLTCDLTLDSACSLARELASVLAGALSDSLGTEQPDGLADALLDGALDDFSQADLSESDLARIFLTGVRWSMPGTRWPPALVDTLMRQSEETEPGSGTYVVTRR